MQGHCAKFWDLAFWQVVSFFSEIPSLLMGPNWKPDFGDTPDESQSETQFPNIGKSGFQYSHSE